MKVLVFEDEAPAARKIVKLINQYDSSIEILDVLESTTDGIEWFDKNPLPDLIFSDIQLADNLSFEVFKSLDLKVPVIFTTAYNEYAIEAFKHYSVDYLLKPIKYDFLADSIDKYKAFTNLDKVTQQPDFEAIIRSMKGDNYRTRFLVHYRDGLIPIETSEIAYFYSEDSVTFLMHQSNKSYVISESLETIENQLNPASFFRANRKYIVSAASVSKVEPYFNQKLILNLSPEMNNQVTVSKLKASQFKDWLNS